jgi:hypothetical protein
LLGNNIADFDVFAVSLGVIYKRAHGAIPVEDGKPRVRLRIRLPDRKLTADIAAKSLRMAQAAIREAGATLWRSFCEVAL